MIGNTKHNSGFTLVEALVASALLSIVVIIVVTMSIQFFGTQRTTRDELYLEGTARQIISLMTERSREAIVDYTFYDGGAPATNPEQFLALRTVEREQTVFWFYDRNVYICDGKAADEECDHAVDPAIFGGDWTRMNPTDISVTIGEFLIEPTSAPYYDDTTLPASDQSPLVTITMELHAYQNNVYSDILQTSITPRLYVR